MAHLLAYANRWSVAPGETLRFFVSCSNESAYSAQLFRLIQPDAGPYSTPFAPEPIPAALNGQHCGRHQTLPIGSLGIVPNSSSFEKLDRFTLAAAVYPTTPDKGRQALIGTWCEADQTGVGLEIGMDGALNLRIGTGETSPFVLSTSTPLVHHTWYWVAVSFSAEKIVLLQEPLKCHSFRSIPSACVSAPRVKMIHSRREALTMGAWCAGDTEGPSPWKACRFSCHFNGRIDRPRIAADALDCAEVSDFLSSTEINPDCTFAAWDFSRNIPEESILDVGPQSLHGTLINLPTRGVTGHNWSGDIFDWRAAPHEYGAIHFHDDDLADACWSADFEFRASQELRSGIYAVRLNDEQHEAWVPFVVRPPRGAATADIVLILPTMTYLAYLNHRARFMSLGSERLHGRLKVLDETDIAFIETPNVGLSTYDRHSDGSGVTYSCRLRPATNMRPTGHLWNFSLDLFIVDWLEHLEIRCDIITDHDLHREGLDLLSPYKLVVTGSHPEYASKDMLDTLELYLRAGGRLMYMGGNGYYSRTAVPSYRDDIIEVRRTEGVRSWDAAPGEQTTSLTGERSGIWRKSGRAPQLLIGVGYVAQGFNQCSHYLRTSAAQDPRISWAFEGVSGSRLGDASVLLGGAAGLEIDSANLDLGTPEHALVIAQSTGHTNAYELAAEEVLTPHGATDGISTEAIHADMVFFETPNGGAVFSCGSIAYAAALGWNGFDNNLCRLTTNLLKRFLQELPFVMPSSDSILAISSSSDRE